MDAHWISLLTALPILAHLGLDPDEKRLRRIGPLHYASHWLFAYVEPVILRLVDAMLSRPSFTDTPAGRRFLALVRKLSWALPHGIVVTTETAERVIDYLDRHEVPRGARFAVGPCVCQRSCNKYKEPVIKDIFLLYAADIFMSLKRGFRLASAEEVKGMLREFRDAGLVHELDFCMQSGRWTFCICNCEKEICVLTRAHLHMGGFLDPGPEIVAYEPEACVGVEACGRCLDRCIFDANLQQDGRVVLDPDKCLGCGLCVPTCKGRARRMVRRENYPRDRTVPSEVLLGERDAGREAAEPQAK